MAAGVVFLGIGAVGVALPVLPTTPFLLLASFCLAKGSRRLHEWFVGTKLYQNHLDSFVRNRAMTLKTKLVYGRGFILFLILFKYIYFFTCIRTIRKEA